MNKVKMSIVNLCCRYCYSFFLEERFESWIYLATKKWVSPDLNLCLCIYLPHWSAFDELIMPWIMNLKARKDLTLGRLRLPQLQGSESVFLDLNASLLWRHLYSNYILLATIFMNKNGKFRLYSLTVE